MMRHCTLLIFFLSAAQSRGQEQPLARLREALTVSKEELRNDQFATCEAMAKRYGITVRVRLEKQITSLDVYCDLTEKQQRRLELGTVGSARKVGSRLIKEVAETANIESHAEALKELTRIRDEMQRLMSNPEQSSFWTKAVDSTLTDEQKQTLATEKAARAAFRKRAWVVQTVEEIDSEILLMTNQRQRLLALFEEWVGENEIPTIQRGRRGPWKMLPEAVVTELVVPKLDAKRARLLLAIAPHSVKEKLNQNADSNK